MANYGTPQPGGTLTDLCPGDSMYLFNNESPSAGQASIAFGRGPAPGVMGPSGIVFTMKGTAGIIIQGSNTDVDADYQTLATSSADPDFYADLGNFAYYRAKSSSGAVTVIAQR